MLKAVSLPSPGDRHPQFVRAVDRDTTSVEFTIDCHPAVARAGDSLLAALLTNAHYVRHLEFNGEPRAGFCLMGACQDCWVWLDGGARVCACTTLVQPAMHVSTSPPDLAAGGDA